MPGDANFFAQWRNQRNYPVDVIGSTRRLRLDDMTHKQQVLTAAYFILADAEPPSKKELAANRNLLERMSPALTELSRATGKYARYTHVPRRALSGLPSGRARKPRVRRAPVGLAT